MAVLIGIDQLTKHLAVIGLKTIDELPVLGEILVLKYCENTGAAFSMFQGNEFILIGITSLCLIVGLVVILSGKIKNNLLLYTVATVVAGGLGNLIDRIFLGYVVDFIYIKIIDFAIFNFADICVTLGGITMIACVVFSEKDKSDAKN